MSSDNPTGADNQQETARPSLELDPHWVVGFVDGEGCFSVSIHANPHVRRTRGWQVNPVFQVSQHESHRAVLEALVRFFGVGRVRSKGSLMRLTRSAARCMRRAMNIRDATHDGTWVSSIRRSNW